MKAQKHHLLLGAHMSISKSFSQAVINGASIGCSTIQIFTKSNRQWAARDISDNEVEEFMEARAKYNIDPVIAHATYLINIASHDIQARRKSIDALCIELERCERLSIPYLVLHPGTATHATAQELENCLINISNSLDYAFSRVPGKTKILLETMAGQGSSLCDVFEHISAIRSATNHKSRIGVCFDTCHVFAAGYDFRTKETYTQMWQDFDHIIGIEHIGAIHLNDSKKGLRSHVDRHADIGKGLIGLDAFSLLMNDKRFFDTPKILETPYETYHDYTKNIELLKRTLSQETQKTLGLHNAI
jgi:deoxyribonuclease-4